MLKRTCSQIFQEIVLKKKFTLKYYLTVSYTLSCEKSYDLNMQHYIECIQLHVDIFILYLHHISYMLSWHIIA